MNQKTTIKKIYGSAASIAVLLLALCLTAAPVAADDDDMSAPSLPMQMYGAAVDANGDPLPAGTVITATVDGITSTYVVKEEGKIGEAGTFGEKFLINGKSTGSTVTFAVNGVETGQTVAFGTGETVEQPKMSFDVVVEKTAATPAGKDDTEKKEDSGKKTEQTSSGTGSGKSSGSAGSDTPVDTKSILAASTPTAEPSALPTELPTPKAQPVSSNVPANPAAQASTPLPFVGIAAGLLAAGVLMRRNV